MSPRGRPLEELGGSGLELKVERDPVAVALGFGERGDAQWVSEVKLADARDRRATAGGEHRERDARTGSETAGHRPACCEGSA